MHVISNIDRQLKSEDPVQKKGDDWDLFERGADVYHILDWVTCFSLLLYCWSVFVLGNTICSFSDTNTATKEHLEAQVLFLSPAMNSSEHYLQFASNSQDLLPYGCCIETNNGAFSSFWVM